MKLLVGSVCDRGLSPKRPVNEDRALALVDRRLFVVCDGVGGHSSGEVASQLAVDTIQEAVERLDGEDPERVLERAVRYANRDIYEMATSSPEFEGMGTTVALLYLDERRGRAIIGHAGDSRVYRFDGRLHRETIDHTDLDDAVREGRITPEQAGGLGKQNTINRALGIEHEVQAEFKTIPFREGDAFLIVSDGVTRHVDDAELEELLGEGLAPDALVEEIRSRCYARGAEDNLTAIAVLTRQPARAAAPPPRAALAGAPRRISVDADAARAAAAPRPRRRSSGSSLLVVLTVVAASALAFFLGRVTASWPGTPRRPLPPEAAAEEAFARGEYSTARAAFSRLSAEQPDRAEYHYWLGRIGLETGDTREAVASLERAVELDPSAADAYLYLAAAYQREDRPREAAEALRRYSEGAGGPSPPAAAGP